MASGILQACGIRAVDAAAKPSHATNPLNEPLLLDINKHSRFTDSLSSLGHGWSDEDTALQSDEFVPRMAGKDIASTIAVCLFVTGGLAASAYTMMEVPSVVVFLMGGVCIVNSPTVARKQLSIAKSEGIRTSVNKIRKKIEVLQDELDFLTQSTSELEAEANMLIRSEQDLRRIATEQGKVLPQIVDLVNENELILSKMKRNLRQTLVTAMAKVVIRSDTDGSMKIDGDEIPLLLSRLQIQLEPHGIILDTDKFESMIRDDNGIYHVLKFCGDLLLEEEPKAYADDDSVGSEVTFDCNTFSKTLSDEPDNMSLKMTYDEKVSMVTVDEKLCKGSVENARGKTMTLMPKNNKKDVRKKTIVEEAKRRQTTLETSRSEPAAKVSKYHLSGRSELVKTIFS